MNNGERGHLCPTKWGKKTAAPPFPHKHNGLILRRMYNPTLCKRPDQWKLQLANFLGMFFADVFYDVILPLWSRLGRGPPGTEVSWNGICAR